MCSVDGIDGEMKDTEQVKGRVTKQGVLNFTPVIRKRSKYCDRAEFAAITNYIAFCSPVRSSFLTGALSRLV